MNYKTNLEMVKLAIAELEKVQVFKIETIDIDSTNYDDGSSSFTVTVNYPCTKEKENVHPDFHDVAKSISEIVKRRETLTKDERFNP